MEKKKEEMKSRKQSDFIRWRCIKIRLISRAISQEYGTNGSPEGGRGS